MFRIDSAKLFNKIYILEKGGNKKKGKENLINHFLREREICDEEERSTCAMIINTLMH